MCLIFDFESGSLYGRQNHQGLLEVDFFFSNICGFNRKYLATLIAQRMEHCSVLDNTSDQKSSASSKSLPGIPSALFAKSSVCNVTQSCCTVNSDHWVHSAYFWWFRFTFLSFFYWEGRSIFVDVMPVWLAVGGHCKGTRSFLLLLHIQRYNTESVFGVFLHSGTTDGLIIHCPVLQPAHLIPRKSDQRRL